MDSSVFLHAFLKPRKKLNRLEKLVKKHAKKIIADIEEGEKVVMTVVHVSEVANIIESRLGLSKSISFVARLFSLSNVNVLGVAMEDYEKALLISKRYSVSINDALAYLKMKEYGIKVIYTFDKHFNNFPDIEKLPKLINTESQ